MAESTGVKSKFESIREWVVDNKLRTVGGLWASGVIGSLAYNWGQPGKASVKIIHARLHAQALTLAALVGAAAVEYYDHKAGGENANRYPKFLPLDTHSQKD
ncbi:UNVERIFIED_CONTAM: hypothetical protein Sradi_2873400 [Sesamum radiatum]|uniref:HIG1 domain-containing protein n=2 Tax=Sesamum TaxID=4181 RepID=A0AAE1WZ84_9LAMI|nr:hypothetical protein Sango_0957300 [Sesamum angolense]